MAKKKATRQARKTPKSAARKASKAVTRARRSARKSLASARRAAKKARRGVTKTRAKAAKRTVAAQTRSRRTAKKAVKAARKSAKAAKKTAKAARKTAKRTVKKAARKARSSARTAKAAATKAGRRATRKSTRSIKKAASSKKKATSSVKKATAAPKQVLAKPRITPRVAAAGIAPAVTPPRAAKEPARRANLDRPRRTVADIHGVPSTLDANRGASSARTGRAEYEEQLQEHTSTSPALSGGDVDADWQSADSVGDEAPGGTTATPDQDVVDEIGRALGVEYDDDEELQGGDEIAARDRHRWELDPSSKDDDGGDENS